MQPPKVRAVILHLFLSIKGHGAVGPHVGAFHKVVVLGKHTAAAADRFNKGTIFDTNVKDSLRHISAEKA